LRSAITERVIYFMKTPFQEPNASGSQHELFYKNFRSAGLSDCVPIVDLRSPIEFIKGSVVGSYNVPLFSDEERHEVGCVYKQQGHLPAVQLGLEFFALKVDRFLEQIIALCPERRVAIYCWRGGMRSHSVARLLTAIGFEVFLFTGGYKCYRKDVLNALESFGSHPLLVLNGRTGSGKTALLRRLPSNFPHLDFEGIANHRGSALGDFNIDIPSPTQQNFENKIADYYTRHKDAATILVEFENFIGPVTLPLVIRNNIRSSPMVYCYRCKESRIEHLVGEYVANWSSESDELFRQRMLLFKKYFSVSFREKLVGLVEERNFSEVVRLLLDQRYDVLYDKNLNKNRWLSEIEFDLTDGFDDALTWISKRVGYKESLL